MDLFIIILAGLSAGFFNNTMDTIIHHCRWETPNPNWIHKFIPDSKFRDWLIYNDYYVKWKDTRLHWLYSLAVFIAQFRDGWHMAKGLMFISLMLPIWYFIGFWWFLAFYLAWSLGFILFYNSYIYLDDDCGSGIGRKSKNDSWSKILCNWIKDMFFNWFRSFRR